MTIPLELWLEPLPPATDLDEGLRARVADPVWFLARQWQLGEHQGEDASSPATVRFDITHQPIAYDPRRSTELDPAVVPAEALVEAEPGDWWTLGRRVRLGRLAAPHLAGLGADQRDALRVRDLPAPYTDLAGEIDGRAVFQSGLLAGHAIWTEVPSPPADRWSARELCYNAPFTADRQRLLVADHDGGDVDWYSVDGASGTAWVRTAKAATSRCVTVLPSRLTYPGAPNPRWWQIEDSDVDIGGFAPDRSHLASLLLLDVVLAHSDDWFWMPIPPPPPKPGGDVVPSVGQVIRLENTIVADSFDQEWALAPPPDAGASAWSMFRTRGLDRNALVVWPVVVAPHAGPLLDEVHLGVDEDANLAWGIEIRADGIPLLDNTEAEQAVRETLRTGTRRFRYLPSTTLPLHWHPYRRGDAGGLFGEWEQGIVADLTGEHPRPRRGPHSQLIGGPSGAGAGRGHHVAARAIPSSGVKLQRRAMLARATTGEPVLWIERSARPLTAPPTSHLRFDVLAEDVHEDDNA
jgi:hypothetical protein